MICDWCREKFAGARSDARFCSKKCRQTAFRLRKRRVADAGVAGRGLFCYADPPYPGLSARYYKNEQTYAGEVDHPLLIAWMEELRLAGVLLGWALSTSNRAVRALLPLCPEVARLCWWGKPIGVPAATYGIHATSEAVIVVGGRQLRPGVRDWLSAQPARGGGELPGRKPIAFCAWLFDLLGMQTGDELLDLFPGTGVVGRAWEELGAEARQGELSFAPAEPSLPVGPGEDGAQPSPLEERHVSDAGGSRVGVRWAAVAEGLVRRQAETSPGAGVAGDVAGVLQDASPPPGGEGGTV